MLFQLIITKTTLVDVRMKRSSLFCPVFVLCRYFDTFDVISDVDASDRLHLARMTAKCSTKEDVGMLATACRN